MIEEKLTLEESLKNLRSAILETSPVKWFLSWVNPTRLMTVTIISAIILFGLIAIGIILNGGI